MLDICMSMIFDIAEVAPRFRSRTGLIVEAELGSNARVPHRR